MQTCETAAAVRPAVPGADRGESFALRARPLEFQSIPPGPPPATKACRGVTK